MENPPQKKIVATLFVDEEDLTILITCLRTVDVLEGVMGTSSPFTAPRRVLLNRLENVKRSRTPREVKKHGP